MGEKAKRARGEREKPDGFAVYGAPSQAKDLVKATTPFKLGTLFAFSPFRLFPFSPIYSFPLLPSYLLVSAG